MSNNRTFFKSVREGHMSLKDIFSDMLIKHTPEESAQVLIAGTALTTPKESEMLSGWQKPYLFFRFFMLCAAVMVMCFGLSVLGYPLGNDVILVLMALVAPITLLILAWEMNIPRDISLIEVLKIVAVGGALSLVINALFSSFKTIFSVMSGYAMGDAVWAPIVEEPAKLAVIYILLMRKNRKYILDGVLIGMAVGTGFAVIETLNYIMNYMRESMVAALIYTMAAGGSPSEVMQTMLAIVEDSDALFQLTASLFMGAGYDMGMEVAIVRALGSFASHGTYAAIYGGGLMIAKGSHPIKPKHLLHIDHLKYFAVACILHALNNSNFPAYLTILFNGFPYIWQILETVIMFALFFLPLLRKGVNQIVEISIAHNGGRVTRAVNRAIPFEERDAEAMDAKLECLTGPVAGKTFPLQEGQSLTLGRAPGCNISLPGASNVSGTHCMIRMAGGQVTVTDLGSTNGTHIGGRELTPNMPFPVTNGMVIQLGNQNCSFRLTLR